MCLPIKSDDPDLSADMHRFHVTAVMILTLLLVAGAAPLRSTGDWQGSPAAVDGVAPDTSTTAFLSRALQQLVWPGRVR